MSLILALLLPCGAADTALVATRDVYVGEALEAGDVARVQRPSFAPADSVLSSPSDAVGRIAVGRMLAGELVRAERLADLDRATTLSGIVPRGMRALRIGVGAEADPVVAGNTVDVLGGGPAGPCTWVEAAFVVAAPRAKLAFARTPEGTLEVLVTPAQAQDVAWAMRGGAELSVSLRNDLDVTTSPDVKLCSAP